MAALSLPASAIIFGFSLHPAGNSFITSVGVARLDIWLLEELKGPIQMVESPLVEPTGPKRGGVNCSPVAEFRTGPETELREIVR